MIEESVHNTVSNTSAMPHLKRDDLNMQKRLHLLAALTSQQSDSPPGYNHTMPSSRKIYDLASAPLITKLSSLKRMETYRPCTLSPLKKRRIAQSCQPENHFKRARSERSFSQGPNKSVEPVGPSGTAVLRVSDNDVLSGRGGATNVHTGNIFFRSLIDAHRIKYLRARKNDKPEISRSIVNIIRRRNGAFLKKNEKTGHWNEIGDDLAREKTSQALRQRAPDYRRRMIEEDNLRISNLSSVPTIANPRTLLSQQLNFTLPNRIIALEYLAVKEKQAELQFHLQMVEELKHRLAIGSIL